MKYYGYGVGVSLLAAALSYFVSTHLLFGGIVLAMFLLGFSFLIVPQILRRKERERKRHECYRFVNSFLISLSVTSSPEQAFFSSTQDAVGEEKLVIDSIETLLPVEKVSYLIDYYEESYYPMFLSILRLFLDQGGDLLTLAEPLLKEMTCYEGNENAIDQCKQRFLIQFLTLWFMSALVLTFIRVGLSSFYDRLAFSFPFQVTLFAYFAVALFSLILFFVAMNGERHPFSRRRHEMVCKKD
jgi:hypothetical protein